MILLEVLLNGEKVALAGTEDLCVLSATFNATGKLGSQSHGTKGEKADHELFLHVGGLTSREPPTDDEHLSWVSHRPLNLGDEVVLRFSQGDAADKPTKMKDADGNMAEISEKRMFEMARDEYFRLKPKYEADGT